jgi:PKD repeat protein
LESRQLLAAWHLDFGSATSPVGAQYAGVTVAAYDPQTGYGWTNPSGVLEVNRASGSDVTRDFHAEKDRTFQVDLPNGNYLVTPTLGDATMIRDRIDLYLNGVRFGSNLTIAAGDPYRPTYLVKVTDGKLALRLVDRGGQTVRWAISALDVVPAVPGAPVVAISPNQIADEGAEVKFQGVATGGAAQSWRWDFGDGTTATGIWKPDHTYADDGQYTVTLTVTDYQGEVGQATSTVTVKNIAPAVSLTGAPTSPVREGTAITLGSSMSDAGAADFAAGFTSLWSVTKDGNAYASASGTLPEFTFTPDDEGTYVVRLKIIDKDGATSATDSVTIFSEDGRLRPNALGPYTGTVGTPVNFAGVARDHGLLDSAAGFSYAWKFGDGGTATGPVASHEYAVPGNYTVTLTVTGRNNEKVTTTTTASIEAAAAASPDSDYQTLASSPLLSNVVYGNVQWKAMAASGAWSVNADWEQGKASKWYIEQQRHGESLIIDGLLHNDTAAINAGFKVFDWGFQRQAADGSFAGTEDEFHSTSTFVAAVARTSLLIRESPFASQYQSKINTYEAKLAKAVDWMTEPAIWSRGVSNNGPFTHRRYLVAAALGLTSKLGGGNSQWMALARSQIQDGLDLQWSNGVNPERDGYDSGYQMAGVVYAQLWTKHFPTDSLTPAVSTMINKAVAWEHSRILHNGEVSIDGNTRTGVEGSFSGVTKTVDWRKVVSAFAWHFQTTDDWQWMIDGQKVAEYYFKTY